MALATVIAAASLGAAAAPQVPAEPAKVNLAVAPEAVPPGGVVHVTVRLSPTAGIKINRYPMMKLRVPEREGLVSAAEVAAGDAAAPPPGESRYYDEVAPLELDLSLHPAAVPGRHDLQGNLVYYYCIPDQFCAPARVSVKIPVTVR
jgi:hypothetical protein